MTPATLPTPSVTPRSPLSNPTSPATAVSHPNTASHRNSSNRWRTNNICKHSSSSNKVSRAATLCLRKSRQIGVSGGHLCVFCFVFFVLFRRDRREGSNSEEEKRRRKEKKRLKGRGEHTITIVVCMVRTVFFPVGVFPALSANSIPVNGINLFI